MTGAQDQALLVLRDIWHAREQTVDDLPTGQGKACKAMKHVGFTEVDDDLRTAWRATLQREGKLGDGTVADLLSQRRDR